MLEVTFLARPAGRAYPMSSCESAQTPTRRRATVRRMRTFDAIIVGAGQAGPPLAGRLTAAGMTVAVIERKLVGGTCVNVGCTPTKTMVASARAAHVARQAAAYGVVVGGPVTVDMRRVKARVDAIVAESHDGLKAWLTAMSRCTL